MVVSSGYLLLVLIGVLLAVSFYTLFERKILSLSHIRMGPAIVGVAGLLQPFSDAVKLFTNEVVPPLTTNYNIYLITPLMAAVSSLSCWVVLPYSANLTSVKYLILLFFIMTGLGVYAHLGAGWSSNSNYAIVGSLRSVAQSISYEVSLSFLLILALMMLQSYNLLDSQKSQWLAGLSLIIPLGAAMWLISCFAETNRAPFDFAEGESELVSGFNIEYGSTGFALLFIGEYASMIFMSTLFVLLFMWSGLPSSVGLGLILIIMYLFVWVRVALPRSRYDKLMQLCWFMILPLSMLQIMTYIALY